MLMTMPSPRNISSPHAGGLPSLGGFAEPWRWVAYKLLLVSLGTAAFLGYYRMIALLAYGRSVDLMTAFDRAIPFVPWTWWIYVPAYALGLLVAIALIDDRRVLQRSMLAILAIAGFNSIFYLTLPSTFPRPEVVLEPGWTAAAYAWLWAVDLPNNTFPSSHVAVGALSVFITPIRRRPLAVIPLLCALAVSVTVLTTKQHYWIDSVSGWAVGGLAFWLIVRPVVPGHDEARAPC